MSFVFPNRKLTITTTSGHLCEVNVVGHARWTREEPMCAGANGCTPIERPFSRPSDYDHRICPFGVHVETFGDPNSGRSAATHTSSVPRADLTLFSENMVTNLIFEEIDTGPKAASPMSIKGEVGKEFIELRAWLLRKHEQIDPGDELIRSAPKQADHAVQRRIAAQTVAQEVQNGA